MKFRLYLAPAALAAASAALGCGGLHSGQAGGTPAPAVRVGDVVVTALGNSVFAAIRSEPLGLAVNANSLFIVNASDVVETLELVVWREERPLG